MFGDILNLLPKDVARKVQEPVVEVVSISSAEAKRACKQKPTEKIFTKDGRLRCAIGNARRDFKLLCIASRRHHEEAPAIAQLNLSDKKLAAAKDSLKDRFDWLNQCCAAWIVSHRSWPSPG